MSLHSPLKLFVGGCGMITSCSVWLFEPIKNPLPLSITSTEPTKTIKTTTHPIYMDLLPPVDKLPNRNGKAIEDQDVEVSKHSDGTSIVLKFKKDTKRPDAVLNQINVEIEKFYVYANSTKDTYQQFDKNSIRISLFKQPAWYSDKKVEEFDDPLPDSQVLELFKENDEVMVKQLLLALNHRLVWKRYDTENRYYLDRVFIQKLDELKDLKIRYFKDFESLKTYVNEKVATCKDYTKSCVPAPGELDYLEVENKEYFQNILNKN